jgi:hypothetical protein
MTIVKKAILIVVVVLGLGAIVGSLLYSLPKTYSLRLEGLEYRLGEENKDEVKPVILVIDGRLKRSLFGGSTFTGKLYIEGERLPILKDKKRLTLKFDYGFALLHYAYVQIKPPVHYSYGTIFTNRDFSAFTISKYERETLDASHSGWSSANGMMITAPAATRAEAIELSNELMQSMLRGARPLE